MTIFGRLLVQLSSILSGAVRIKGGSIAGCGYMDDKADLLLGAASLVFVLALVLALIAEALR